MPKASKTAARVVSALHVRANLGRLLHEIEGDRTSLVIEKRGTPRAVLLSIREYVRLAAPEPDVLKAIGQESIRRGTDTLSSGEIDRIVRAARRKKSTR